MAVSMAAKASGEVGAAICCAWRMTKVNVNMRSSSFDSLSRKAGPVAGFDSSVSYTAGKKSKHMLETKAVRGREGGCVVYGWALRTWMNSMGALSPSGRDVYTLLAGNAFGTMLIDVRFRGLVMTSDEMDTAKTRKDDDELAIFLLLPDDRKYLGRQRKTPSFPHSFFFSCLPFLHGEHRFC